MLESMPTDRSSRDAQPPSRRGLSRTGRDKPASQVLTREESTLQLHDPRDIRALAHPARMAIIDALAPGDELTATECAGLTGLSPSATAYHLKLLERYGFAEPAPARSDGRERPWRATHRTRINLDASTPAGAAATAAVGLAYFDRTRAMAEAFVANAYEEPEEWRDAAFLTNTDLWLTIEETREMSAALGAVLELYQGRTLADRPDGSRRVRVMSLAMPHRRR
jgi:DNA-binding transcriptional ArsR family regulator